MPSKNGNDTIQEVCSPFPCVWMCVSTSYLMQMLSQMLPIPHLFLICCPLTFSTSVFISCMDILGNINGVPILPIVDFPLLIISGYLCGSFSFTPAPIFFFPYKSLAYRGTLSTGEWHDDFRLLKNGKRQYFSFSDQNFLHKQYLKFPDQSNCRSQRECVCVWGPWSLLHREALDFQ